jgi:minor extracellular serine protease Vpr
MPLVHAFPLQVDAQVPWELAGQAQAQLAIVTDDLNGNTVGVPLAPFSPGLYAASGNGAGQGAILINGTTTLAAPANSQYNGQPAQRGVDYIDIFATGLGPVTNQPATGAAAPATPLAETTKTVTVTIGGVPATVTFAGLAPGWVGLYQVNVQVPANAPVSNAVPVALSVGGVAANQVTIAVEQ